MNSENADKDIVQPAAEVTATPAPKAGGAGRTGGKGGTAKRSPNAKAPNPATAFRPIQMPDRDPTGNTVSPKLETAPVRAPAPSASIKGRHRFAFMAFLVLVALPMVVMGGYLAFFAQDQYASEAGFSVRKEENSSSVDQIGGLTQLTGSASTDAEILYDFIQSQNLVEQVDSELDLVRIYGRNHSLDPIFTLAKDSTIEDKLDFWSRVVTVEYNEATGLIRLQVLAFSPEEAQMVGRSILANSSAMINRLSIAARDDATRYARDDFAKAVERLKDVRELITEFRSRTQVVDPLADIQGQMGLLNTLEGQLAAALIDLDMLKDVASANDPRTAQAERRIEVINRRLAEERKKFGIGGSGGPQGRDYASIVAEYERLMVDRQVAEDAFKSATILLDTAVADAQRKSRYLAAHVEPTLAQSAQYPRNMIILSVGGFFLFMIWALSVLIYYSIRDRR